MKLTCRIGCDKQQVYLMYGVSGTALDWIASYLSDRTQQVYYRGRLSAVSQLLFGVPQGSVLGPLLLLLYVAGVFEVIDALVAGRYTYIATSTDVLKILDTDIVFLQSVDVDAYVVYSLTKCSPSVT